MTRTGRPAKPPALKRLEGNPGQRRIPEGFVEPSGDIVKPNNMTPYASAVWDRMIAAMPPGVYTSADFVILGAYCAAADLHLTATIMLTLEGGVINGVYGPKVNPWNAIQARTGNDIVKMGAQLGLAPSTRQSIKMPEKKKTRNDFEGLIGSGDGT